MRLASVVLLLASSAVPAAAAPARPPNILWITVENVGLDFGCYGQENVSTPNIDSLADAGVRYRRVFSTSPVCAPSRSCLMTGMYPTTIGVHNMRSHRKDDYRLPPGVRPLTHRLQDVGYYTANVTTIGEKVVGTGKLDLNFVNEGPIFQSDDWSQLSAHQPFFAQISTPEAEYDIYEENLAEVERVKWVGEDWHPKIATPKNVTPPPYYPDHRIVRQEWARYLNSVSGMDVRVGWILQALKREGLWDNTVIILFGDNGRLEARGIHWCYDSGLHVPLIIRWPENYPAPPQIKPGTVCEEVISLMDLTATTLHIAGIPKPALMQSRAFLGTDRDPPRRFAFSARDRIDGTVNRIRSVRGKRYHYIRNYMPEQSFSASLNRYKETCFPVKPLMRRLRAEGKLTGAPAELMAPRLPREQLFDTQSDPHEIQNLAQSNDPEIQSVLTQSRTALDVWITETDDLGRHLEPPDVVNRFQREMHDWFGTPEWYRQGRDGGAGETGDHR